MAEPRRFRQSRLSGAHKPENSLCVSRPGYMGNPFEVADFLAPDVTEAQARAAAVRMYQDWLTGRLDRPDLEVRRQRVLTRIPKLRGVNLGCYCELPDAGEVDWCHAAVLLAIAAGQEWVAA